MANINPAGFAQLQARLQARALEAATAAAEELGRKLEGEGTGIHWPSLPRRSSRPGEYPAEQTGELRRSVGSRTRGQHAAEFGLLNPPAYAALLHFKPPSAGGRPVMDMALADADIQRAVLETFKDGPP